MAYGEFAAVYDRLMDDFDYPKWAEYYLALLRRGGIVPKTICECACGTGSLTEQFAAAGIRVIASDLSAEMLEEARKKLLARGVQAMLVCRDMCRMEVPKPVDAVICGCDGVNYLTSDAQLTGFFRSAYAMLKPGGMLAFDISSEYKLREVIGSAFFGEERNNIAYLWSNNWNEKAQTVDMDLTFFVCEKDGRYKRFEEHHIQKAHSASHLEELLRECGFENIEIYGDRTFEAPQEKELRIHMTARRSI